MLVQYKASGVEAISFHEACPIFKLAQAFCQADLGGDEAVPVEVIYFLEVLQLVLWVTFHVLICTFLHLKDVPALHSKFKMK